MKLRNYQQGWNVAQLGEMPEPVPEPVSPFPQVTLRVVTTRDSQHVLGPTQHHPTIAVAVSGVEVAWISASQLSVLFAEVTHQMVAEYEDVWTRARAKGGHL